MSLTAEEKGKSWRGAIEQEKRVKGKKVKMSVGSYRRKGREVVRTIPHCLRQIRDRGRRGKLPCLLFS